MIGTIYASKQVYNLLSWLVLALLMSSLIRSFSLTNISLQLEFPLLYHVHNSGVCKMHNFGCTPLACLVKLIIDQEIIAMKYFINHIKQ